MVKFEQIIFYCMDVDMARTVLARKWRPKKFTDLIGQQTAVTVLNNMLQDQRLHHAYLLTGTRGVGKTTIARIIATALNCTNLCLSEPCGVCANCQAISKGSFVDVIEIDAASNTGVDNIRELIDNASYAPTLGKYKVYIIDEVHMLSKSAFNAMLKTLEEPPLHAIFVLATTDMQKVPITVLSRCLQLKLRNLLPAEISAHLATILQQEAVTFEAEALDAIAYAAQGSMRDALSITDQAIAYTNSTITLAAIKIMLGIIDEVLIYNLLRTISEQNSSNLITIANDIYHQNHDLENVLLKLNQILCDISLIQLGALENEKLQQLANCFSINDVQLYFEITNLGLEQIAKGNNKYQIFTMTLLRMLAFTLGCSEDKQAIMQNSNSNITAINIEPSLTADAASAAAKSREFSGNWLQLVEELEAVLDKAIHPVLLNARFESYVGEQFNLTVDQRYESVVSANIIANISRVFSEYFNHPINFNFQFAQNITATLREKRQNEQEQKLQLAEDAIKKDANLIQMQQLFSATIVPNSIKPV